MVPDSRGGAIFEEIGQKDLMRLLKRIAPSY